MNRRNIVIGLLGLIATAVVLYNTKGDDAPPALEPTPSPSIESRIEERFNTQIPDDAEKAELEDVSGGDGQAIATRTYEAGEYNLTVLADLEDPEAGAYYGWLARSEPEASEYIRLGQFREAKGGWVLDFESADDLMEYNKVVISAEQAPSSAPTSPVLEGAF